MPIRDPNNARQRFVFAFALVASLAGLWGFGHRLHDSLVPFFGQIFDLHGFHLALVTSIYNVVYTAWALPAALYARRFGYKAAILLGLGCVAVGAFTFYPAAETRSFAYYAIATTLMASGWLTLEIAANPLFAAWGNPKYAIFRLNLAQSLYPLGAIVGILVGRWLIDSEFALPKAASAYPIGHPYIVIGGCVLLWAFLIEETAFPTVAQDRIPGLKGIGGEIKALLARPLIGHGMLAQFCAVAATGLTWATIAGAVHSGLPAWHFIATRDVILLYMALFAVGRLLGTGLMFYCAPAKVLLFYVATGSLLALSAALFGGSIACFALLGLPVTLSLTWPTVLGLAIDGLGQHMKVATALLAIGGAIAGVAYNFALTAWGGSHGALPLIIIAFCCVGMASFAWRCMNRRVIGMVPQS